jgi:hypothetical protein
MSRIKWYKVLVGVVTLAMMAFSTSVVFADSSSLPLANSCPALSRSDLESVLPSHSSYPNAPSALVCSNSSSHIYSSAQLAGQATTGEAFVAGWNNTASGLQASIPVTGGNVSDVWRDAGAGGFLPSSLQSSPAVGGRSDDFRDEGASGFLPPSLQSSPAVSGRSDDFRDEGASGFLSPEAQAPKRGGIGH